MKTQNNLENILIQHVDQNGFIGLGEYISLALGHPKYGYYVTRDPLGEQGDFTTAPEISQMFGEVIGAWVIDVWAQMGAPSRFNLIELGPGRGTLMSDILRVGKNIPEFLDAVQPHLVEVSPILRDKQAKALSAHSPTWHDSISEISTDAPTLILGNEFLDALPVEHLKRTERGWQKKVVKWSAEDSAFTFDWTVAEKTLRDFLPSKTVSNEIYEVAPVRLEFMDLCAAYLNKTSGVALFIDYGYLERHFGDTLQAIKSHDFIDVLQTPGQCDLTTHIDFESLSDRLSAQDVSVTSCVNQGAFLRSLGIDIRALALKKKASGEQAKAIDGALSRLVSVDQMGGLFKVLCFHSGVNIKPEGFK